jgi:hypothetical protein
MFTFGLRWEQACVLICPKIDFPISAPGGTLSLSTFYRGDIYKRERIQINALFTWLQFGNDDLRYSLPIPCGKNLSEINDTL